MSGYRELRPHELARRDQILAGAKARMLRGGLVSWVDLSEPGKQCSYCDCPITPDSPHNQPGYVCDQPCQAEALYMIAMACLSPPIIRTFPVCERHCDAQNADLRELLGATMPIEVLPGWIDDERASS